jgi:hypothetical protein
LTPLALPPDEGGLSKILVDWAQVFGSLVGGIALLIAIIAFIKGPRDIAKERQRQHELSVLREISDLPVVASEAHPGSRLGTKLLFFAGEDDFPQTRAALLVRAAPSEIERFNQGLRTHLASRYERDPSYTPAQIKAFVDGEMDQWDYRWNYLTQVTEDGISTFRRELNEAITRRR